MMIGIAGLVGAPDLLERGELAGEPGSLFLRPVCASGLGFVVDQRCPGLVEGLPPPAVELHAQVDIVEGDGEANFVEAPDGQELALFDDHACGGHGAHPLR